MPLPLIPLIGAGLGAGSSIFNTISQSRMNNKQIEQSDKMYARQRADNLSDWHMQNEYNSPINQMKRFKEAGLNPNLIYGQGTEAAPVRSADVKQPSLNAPMIDAAAISNPLLEIYDVQKKQAEIKAIEAQRAYTAANTMRTLKDTDLKAFNLFKQQEFYDLDLDMKREDLLYKRSQVALNLGENERRWVMQGHTISETLARIEQIKANTTKVPYEKKLLEANANNIRNMTYWRNLTEKQQMDMNNIIMSGKLIDQVLTGKHIESRDLKNELDRIMIGFRRVGVSPTVTSDVIKTITDVIGKGVSSPSKSLKSYGQFKK